MAEPTAADVRAVAVAKLKRAASLPRMKDGRRPPMHDDAVSEGDKTNNADGATSQPDEVTDMEQKPPVPVESKGEEPLVLEDRPINGNGRDTPSKNKRRGRSRSRSRSRSRGSKDFKEAAAKAELQSLNRPSDSSPEEQLPPIPFFTPTLASPIPSHFTTLPMHPRAFLPSTSPHHFIHSPTSPPPTLEALRAGLIRSNSAAARVRAINKLTGGRDSPTNYIPTPSITPPPGGGLMPRSLSRSNTVTGVERSTVRTAMLKRLEKRAPLRDGGESDLTSGAEDLTQAVDSSSSGQPSKNGSPAISNAVIDDRDLPSTAPASPFERSTILPTPVTSDVQRHHEDALARLNGEDHFEYENHLRNAPPLPTVHGIVIEEDEVDDMPHPSTRQLVNQLPIAPSRRPSQNRVPHVSDAPSSTSSILTGTDQERIPVFLQEAGQKSPYEDQFPVTISPDTTPVREKGMSGDEDDGEKVVYPFPEEMKPRRAFLSRLESKRDLSWIGLDNGINLNSAPTVQTNAIQIHIHDDSQTAVNDQPAVEEEQEEEEVELTQIPQEMPQTSTVPFPHNSDTDEVHPSRETSPSVVPETPSSALTFSQGSPSEKPASDGALPARESIASSTSAGQVPPSSPPVAPVERVHSEIFTDWEEVQTDREGLTDRESSHRIERSPSRKKRESGSVTTSRWERVKGTFSGRRSRSNSFARPRKDEKPETSVSRESAVSGKTDQNATPAGSPSSSQLVQGHSSSGSLLSLAASPVPPPRGGISPVPPISPAGLAKYTDPKLMPLPGLMRLEEERRTRVRRPSTSGMVDGFPLSASGTVPNTRVNSPEPGLVHQSSDSRLLARYRSSGEATTPGAEDTEPEDGRITPGFFDIPINISGATSTRPLNLPQTKEAALKWLTQRKKAGNLWNPQSSTNGNANGHVSDSGTVRQNGRRKPSLTDLLSSARANDSGTERDERTDRTASATPRAGSRRRAVQEQLRRMAGSPTLTTSHAYSLSSSSAHSVLDDKTLPVVRPQPETNGHSVSMESSSSSQSIPSPQPNGGSQDSEVVSRPNASLPSPIVPSSIRTSKSSAVFQRLESILSSSNGGSARGSSALGDPPRKLLLSSFVRQIVSPNEVKNRLLLLFNDILVIAKFSNEDVVRDPLDRSLLVRSVVELHKVSLEILNDQSTTDFMQLSPVKTFVRQFPSNPDEALASCIKRAGLTSDPATVGNLLFKSIGVDPRVLGSFLARRSNKTVLRAFLDRFGFKGMRIDMALRVFILAIRLPSEPNAVEHLLSTFASRWFDANQGVVAFDRDLATRLVLALVQLDGALHKSSPLDEIGMARPFSPSSQILARDFVEAFRLMDPHVLVGDDLLHKIYISIRNERLVQALDESEKHTQIPANLIPSELPDKLTTRIPSQPITIRIPKPDPHLRIHLHGQDLFFDPPVLDFSRSNEASFVVIGSTLGMKDMIMARTGANAARYSQLPLTKSIHVERSFMQNTFTLGFVNPRGIKRKFRFNVPDDEEYKQWKSLLKRQIHQRVAESTSSQSTNSSLPLQLQQAAETVAIQALRNAIIPPEDLPPPSRTPSQSVATNSSTPENGNSPVQKAGPVKGNDLVVICVQNSLIPVVLSFLQVAQLTEQEPTGVGGHAIAITNGRI